MRSPLQSRFQQASGVFSPAKVGQVTNFQLSVEPEGETSGQRSQILPLRLRPELKAFFAQKTNPPVGRRIGFFNCHSVEHPAHRLANGRSIPAEADCLMSKRLVAPMRRKRANGCAFDVRDIVDYN